MHTLDRVVCGQKQAFITGCGHRGSYGVLLVCQSTQHKHEGVPHASYVLRVQQSLPHKQNELD